LSVKSKYDISRKLIESLTGAAQNRTTSCVVFGLRYCGVKLDSGECGVAFNFLTEDCHNSEYVGGNLSPAGRPAAELLGLLGSVRSLERSLGLATANALAAIESRDYLSGDVLGSLRLRPTDKVAMVGDFRPLEPQLRSMCAELKILELKTNGHDGLIPFEQAESVIPFTDVVIVTGAAIVNGTLDEILEMAEGCRELAVLGPSTPLCPVAFEGSPATMLSGNLIKDADFILKTITEGGGTRRFKPGIRKVNLRI